MEKGILACLKEDISNVAKQDIIILGLQENRDGISSGGEDTSKKMTPLFH